MGKSIRYIFLIGLVIALVAFIGYGTKLQQAQNTSQIISAGQKEQLALEQQTIVGNDRDEHGCIGSAGYEWCELKQKCMRTWEEECLNQNQGRTVPILPKDRGIVK